VGVVVDAEDVALASDVSEILDAYVTALQDAIARCAD
jgi:hypothetical protein